jgi:hypothetical protein
VQYIVAGLWLIAPLVFFCVAAASLAASIVAKYSDAPAPPKSLLGGIGHHFRIVLEAIQLFAVLLFLTLSIPLLAFDVSPPLTNSISFYLERWRTFAKLFGFWFGICATGFACWYNSRFPKRLAWFFISVLVCLLIFAWYVVFFSTNVYPQIPYNLGGGKPLSVVFLLKANTKEPVPLIPDNSGTRSVPYKMLLATDRTLVVLAQDERERSIEFSRDAVLGVVVLKETQVPETIPHSVQK